MEAKIENRGGAREGSGRPRKPKAVYSDVIRKDIMSEMKRMQAETGKSFGRVVCELAWNENVYSAMRIAACKLISEIYIVKETKQTVEVNKAISPQIYLPAIMEKPKEAEEKERIASDLN